MYSIYGPSKVTSVARASDTRTARRVAANREAILDAAEDLLVEGGVDAITVDAVAERADVALQTVYNRVGRRPEVLVAIAERAVEDNRRYMDAAFAVEGTPLDRFTAVVAAYVRFAQERPHHFELLSNPPNEPGALQPIAAKIAGQMAKLADVLASGMADGSFTSSMDPANAAVALWAMMDGVLSLRWRADRTVTDPQRLHDIIAISQSLVVDGLRSR
ncbi:TetR/AcrR family transcriptional regulator [soil metagenome]